MNTVNTPTNKKYVYLFSDTMKNQDFIPTDVTTAAKYGKTVDGLRVKIKASGSLTEAVYKEPIGFNMTLTKAFIYT